MRARLPARFCARGAGHCAVPAATSSKDGAEKRPRGCPVQQAALESDRRGWPRGQRRWWPWPGTGAASSTLCCSAAAGASGRAAPRRSYTATPRARAVLAQWRSALRAAPARAAAALSARGARGCPACGQTRVLWRTAHGSRLARRERDRRRPCRRCRRSPAAPRDSPSRARSARIMANGT